MTDHTQDDERSSKPAAKRSASHGIGEISTGHAMDRLQAPGVRINIGLMVVDLFADTFHNAQPKADPAGLLGGATRPAEGNGDADTNGKPG